MVFSWYWIVDSNTLAIEEYHATPEGYLRTASVASGEDFQPQLFPGLTINLMALLGVEPPAPPRLERHSTAISVPDTLILIEAAMQPHPSIHSIRRFGAAHRRPRQLRRRIAAADIPGYSLTSPSPLRMIAPR